MSEPARRASDPGPRPTGESHPPPQLLTGANVRLCALRSAIAAVAYVIVVEALVVLPSSWAVSTARVLLYAFLAGLLFGPVSLLERWARADDDHETLRAIVASAGVLVLAMAGGGLAWTQANYTAVAIETGSLTKALSLVQSGSGPISRASALATVLYITPPIGAAAATYLRLRLSDHRGSLPAGLLTLMAASFLISQATPDYGHQNAAMLFAASALSVPLVTYAVADRLNARWSSEASTRRSSVVE